MFAPANFKQNGGEYLKTANDNILVIVQIESRMAVENCEKIAAVEGIGKNLWCLMFVTTLLIQELFFIDMLFIGPNDLAASMGYWAPDHARILEVQEATARVLKAAKDAGKYAGHFALSADIGMSEQAHLLKINISD